jgi:large subunit ribosomal protein L31
MKKDIHPKYFNQALVKCACGNEFKIGSTKEAILVEICSNCHPFYTGQEKIIDTAGRVEKFKARRAAAKPIVKKKKSKTHSNKKEDKEEKAKKES